MSGKGRRRKKILNENRKDLCFYSAEIECNWEWIRFPVGEIEEYSQGLFLHTVDWFQFSGTGIPGIWFHFISWQRGQSWSASVLRNANRIARSAFDAMPTGSIYMCGKYRKMYGVVYSVHAHCEAWRMIQKKRKGERWRSEIERKKGDGVTGCSCRWLWHTRMHADTRRRWPNACCSCCITLALRSTVLDGDEYEGPSSAVTVSNGSGLFSLTAPCLGKGVAQKGTDLSLKRKLFFKECWRH